MDNKYVSSDYQRPFDFSLFYPANWDISTIEREIFPMRPINITLELKDKGKRFKRFFASLHRSIFSHQSIWSRREAHSKSIRSSGAVFHVPICKLYAMSQKKSKNKEKFVQKMLINIRLHSQRHSLSPVTVFDASDSCNPMKKVRQLKIAYSNRGKLPQSCHQSKCFRFNSDWTPVNVLLSSRKSIE